jgi:predicted methyltransferase
MKSRRFLLGGGLASACAGPLGAQTPPSTAPGPQRILPPNRPISLEVAAAGPWRVDPQRDLWRRPVQTLRFFGLRPTDSVIEIWPGGGWYSAILGPFLKSGGGRLTAALLDPPPGDSYAGRINEAYRNRFVAQPDLYGAISTVLFGPLTGPLAPAETVDAIYTFRNVHNWMAEEWVEKAFADFFQALKPGGVLGVEEHRAAPRRGAGPPRTHRLCAGTICDPAGAGGRIRAPRHRRDQRQSARHQRSSLRGLDVAAGPAYRAYGAACQPGL